MWLDRYIVLYLLNGRQRNNIFVFHNFIDILKWIITLKVYTRKKFWFTLQTNTHTDRQTDGERRHTHTHTCARHFGKHFRALNAVDLCWTLLVLTLAICVISFHSYHGSKRIYMTRRTLEYGEIFGIGLRFGQSIKICDNLSLLFWTSTKKSKS